MTDVFVIGAGPSGLLMAAELLRQGLICRIIDKSPTASIHSKAIVIQARSLEMLTTHGITEICINEGLKIEHFIPISGQQQLADISFGKMDSPFPLALSLEQNKFEAILIQHLKDLGCEVERQFELLACKQDDNHVTLTIRNNITGEMQTHEAKWLIGCDGPHSTVRKLMELTFEGLSFPQVFSLADVEVQWGYPKNSILAFMNKTNLIGAIPIQGGRLRLIFQLARAQELLKQGAALDHGEITSATLKPPTLEEVTQLLQEYADSQATVTNPVWMANFSINSRMVSQYQKNRVFLVGDAAHIHSPVGGQGMNTGLQDGFNLGWKLALVHKGLAKRVLLDSYHTERHFVGKKLLKGTEKMTHLVLTRMPFFFALRNCLMKFLGSFSFFQKKIARTVAEIDICYPKSQWIRQKKTRHLKLESGIRAPDATIHYLGRITSLFALWKNSVHFKLLLIDSKNTLTITFRNEFDTLKKHYGKFVDIYILDTTDQAEFFIIEDVQNEVKGLYGDGVIYLIRPDGYICYCGPSTSLEEICIYFEQMRIF